MTRKIVPLVLVLAGTVAVVAGVAIGTVAVVASERLRAAFADPIEWEGVEDE